MQARPACVLSLGKAISLCLTCCHIVPSSLDYRESLERGVPRSLNDANINSKSNLPGTGVPKKTGHCLISCNVKAIKAIAMK